MEPLKMDSNLAALVFTHDLVPEEDQEQKTLILDLMKSLGYINGVYTSDLALSTMALMMVYTLGISDNLQKYPSTMDVVNILKDNTEDAYLVGGAVRDSIMGTKVNDFDFCTDTPITELQEPFEKAGYKVQKEGLEFLVLIVSKGGHQYEIANFRKDSKTSDGRRPDYVEIGTIEEDAHRRDFTINSLYFDINSHNILDPCKQGLTDIENGILRFIGKPIERLREDYIRAFRFMKFTKRGFTPDPKSQRTIKAHFREIIEKSNPERILTEFVKMELL